MKWLIGGSLCAKFRNKLAVLATLLFNSHSKGAPIRGDV